MAPITHIVVVGFKDGVSAESVKEVRIFGSSSPPAVAKSLRPRCQLAAGFFKLKDTCVNPATQQPYLLSSKGGKDNAPEGLQVRSHLDADAQSSS